MLFRFEDSDLYTLLVDMSTRKIKLSQKLTLRFRDISMPDASAVADLLEEPDQSSSAETFDSLPDLLPYIFKSQTESPASDLTYFVSDCSTYKLWESCTTDVIPLASPNEEAEHWPSNGTHTRGANQPLASQNEEAGHWPLTSAQTRGANNSESSDDTHKNLKSNDRDSVTEVTKIGARDNLRRVQAFSPHTSILYVENDLSLDGLPVREDVWCARDDVACDHAVVEIGRQPDPLDIDADTNEICVDSYLIPDEDMAKELPFDEPTDADETAENSRLSSIINEAPDGLEVEKHPEVKKQSTRRKSSYQASDFPKEVTKQKRSTPRRRDPPSASVNLVRKLNWLTETEQDHQGHLDADQGAHVTANIVEKTIPKTRKPRSTKSVTSVTSLSSKTPASQPRSRRGRKANPLRYVTRSQIVHKNLTENFASLAEIPTSLIHDPFSRISFSLI